MQSGFPDDVCIGIVSYNGRRKNYLARCIAANLAAGCPPERIFVADVASDDDTLDYLKANHPDVHVLALEHNRGPNPARNALLKNANAPLLLLLDVDIQIDPDTTPRMREVMMKDRRIAAVTPTIVFEDDRNQVLSARSWAHYLGEASSQYRNVPIDRIEGDCVDVGNIPGAAPLLRVDIARQIGLFDEAMFYGKTDGDFAYRLAAHGYRAVEMKSALVMHPRQNRGSSAYLHQLSNRWYFILKNYQWRTIVLCLPILLLHDLVTFVFLASRGLPLMQFRALAMLWRRRGTLMQKRRALQAARVVPDHQILRGDHLVTPAKKGPVASLFAFYDSVAQIYWRCARAILRQIPGSRPVSAPPASVTG